MKRQITGLHAADHSAAHQIPDGVDSLDWVHELNY